jgi:hypothetical protein
MRYIILTASNADELEKTVNQKIKTGWQPLGGVQLAMAESPTHHGMLVYYFAQTMTLNE